MHVNRYLDIKMLINIYIYKWNIVASNVKQRGDQIITSEDDLVAPAAPDDTKKNEVDTSKDAKG